MANHSAKCTACTESLTSASKRHSTGAGRRLTVLSVHCEFAYIWVRFPVIKVNMFEQFYYNKALGAVHVGCDDNHDR